MRERIKTKRLNIKIILLGLIFFVPMVISWVMYTYPDYFSLRTLNHGKLMDPLVVEARLINTEHPTWQIMYAPQDCDSPESIKNMYLLHQVHTALGKDADRVGLTLLTEKECPIKEINNYQRLVGGTETLRKVVIDHKVERKIYLVDPRGNVFIYYSEAGDGMRILKDLKRVLEVSQIG